METFVDSSISLIEVLKSLKALAIWEIYNVLIRIIINNKKFNVNASIIQIIIYH